LGAAGLLLAGLQFCIALANFVTPNAKKAYTVSCICKGAEGMLFVVAIVVC
jgi:hypothetical protein